MRFVSFVLLVFFASAQAAPLHVPGGLPQPSPRLLAPSIPLVKTKQDLPPSAYPQVVYVKVEQTANNPSVERRKREYGCSGVVLHGSCVLTAKHCLETEANEEKSPKGIPFTYVYETSSVSVKQGKSGKPALDAISAQLNKLELHPKLDMAILRLDEDLGAENSFFLDDILDSGSGTYFPATIVGYGANKLEGEDRGHGIKRSAIVRIERSGSSEHLLTKAQQISLEHSEFGLDGDSGGALLLEQGRARPVLLGILIERWEHLAKNRYVSVSNEKEWIATALAKLGCISKVPKYRPTESTVRKWYAQYLHRLPDPQGLAHWEAKLTAPKADLYVVRDEFWASEEVMRMTVTELFFKYAERPPTLLEQEIWRRELQLQGYHSVEKRIRESLSR